MILETINSHKWSQTNHMTNVDNVSEVRYFRKYSIMFRQFFQIKISIFFEMSFYFNFYDFIPSDTRSRLEPKGSIQNSFLTIVEKGRFLFTKSLVGFCRRFISSHRYVISVEIYKKRPPITAN